MVTCCGQWVWLTPMMRQIAYGPAAGSVSCQIPSALYNPSHDLFRSAAVQSYSPPASSDVSSESTLQYTVVYSTVRPFHCTSPPMPTESLPLGSGQRVPPHCMRVPREVTHHFPRDTVRLYSAEALSARNKKICQFGRLPPYAAKATWSFSMFRYTNPS